MKSFLALVIFGTFVLTFDHHHVNADGSGIASAARSQIGVPYSWGGGGINGKSRGIGEGANTVGFDCSGLAQFSVYQGTKKVLARTAAAQYSDSHCYHVSYASHQPGDLVFFGNPPYHVGIISAPGKMIDAPHTGTNVREESVWSDHLGTVQRCW